MHSTKRHNLGLFVFDKSGPWVALDSKHCIDFSRVNLINILHLVSMHFDDSVDSDSLLLFDIKYSVSLGELSLVGSAVCQLSILILF